MMVRLGVLLKRKEGFTLIELLVVVAIIGILVSLVFPVISRVKTSAKVAAAKSDERALVIAIDSYYSEYRRLPIPDEILTAPNYSSDIIKIYNIPFYYAKFHEYLCPGGGWELGHNKISDEASNLLQLIIGTLQGSNSFRGETTGLNSRDSVFLRRQEGRPIGLYMDPWSRGINWEDDSDNRQYMLIFDHDLNGVVKYWSSGNDERYAYDTLAVVRCRGPNRKMESTFDDPDYDDIFSVGNLTDQDKY